MNEYIHICHNECVEVRGYEGERAGLFRKQFPNWAILLA